MRLFGGERMDRIFSTLGVDEEIAHPLWQGGESAQRRVEGMNLRFERTSLNTMTS